MDKQCRSLYFLIVFNFRSAFLTNCYHIVWKNGIQQKNYIRADGSSHEFAGQWLFMQRCCTVVRVWKVANFQDQVQKRVIFTASFYKHEYVHNFKVLFNLFKFVTSVWNKHIHLNRLYQSIVNVWWSSEVMCISKTGSLAWGTPVM